MPKLKTNEITHWGSYFRYNAVGGGASSVIAAFPEDGEYIHFGKDNLDPNTAYPVQNVVVSGLPYVYPVYDYPRYILSTKPIAASPQLYVPTVDIAMPQTADGNVAYRAILDKDLKANTGNVIKFEDSAGVKHGVYSTYRKYVSYASYYATSIIEGDNYQGVSANTGLQSYGATLEYGGTQKSNRNQCFPLFVDVASGKIVYWIQYKYSTSSAYPGIGMPGFGAGTFTTNAVDGSLSIGVPTVLNGLPIAHPGGYGPVQQYGETQSIFYCGRSNAGNPCFLLVSENEINYVNNNAANNWSTSTGWSKATHGSRLTFVEHDLSAATTTVIAGPLGASTSWSANTGASAISGGYGKESWPTHFEASPIDGEDDVFYAFLPVAAVTTYNLGMLVCRWDKGDGTFQAYPCNIDMNGAGLVSDYFYHAGKNGTTTSMVTATLTKDANGDLFVSVYNQHVSTAYTTHTADARYNNCISFSVAASNNLRDLTYHSTASFAALSCVAKDADCTTLHMISVGAAKVMTWNSVSGWTAAGTYPGTFYAVTEDANGTLLGISSSETNLFSPTTWIIASNPLDTTAARLVKEIPFTLELLAPDLPNSVQVRFEDNSISFDGTPIQKNVIVNAFDPNGNRLASNVTLKISGSSAVFTSNSSSTLQVTTSAGGDTTVSLTINAAGYLNVSASFAV